MTERSSAGLIQRISLSSDENHGIKFVARVPGDVPAMVAFGGGLTDSAQPANYYASQLFKLLDYNDVHGVNVYSVYYDLQGQNSRLMRANEFRRAGRRMRREISAKEENIIYEMLAAEPSPQYIQQLVDIILRPRVFDTSGARLPLDEALRRVRKLKFFSHCHGSMVIYLMGRIMRREMRAAGYSVAEINQIQKQLLVVQYAPANPLEKSDFTVLSFASASDNMMAEHNNNFADYMMAHVGEVKPMFMSGRRGNIVMAGELHEGIGTEHDLSMDMWMAPYLTEWGDELYTLMRHALVRGAEHSLHGGALPEMSKILTDSPAHFDRLNKDGETLYTKMLQSLRRRGK